jgi:hypothetical protein
VCIAITIVIAEPWNLTLTGLGRSSEMTSDPCLGAAKSSDGNLLDFYFSTESQEHGVTEDVKLKVVQKQWFPIVIDWVEETASTPCFIGHILVS